MSKFNRASLQGSEELFRPTRPRLVEEATEDSITELVERQPKEPHEQHRHVILSLDELALVLDAIQAAKYPERARRLSLDKFERYDALRDKLQAERDRV
jgi:hypothetical protein